MYRMSDVIPSLVAKILKDPRETKIYNQLTDKTSARESLFGYKNILTVVRSCFKINKKTLLELIKTQ